MSSELAYRAARSNLPAATHALPTEIAQNDEMAQMHAALIQGLLFDAKDVKMSTILNMLVSELAQWFVVMRWKTENDDWLSEKSRRDTTMMWTKLVEQYRQMVQTANGDSDAQRKAAEVAAHVIDRGLDGLHADVSGPLRDRFARVLEDSGF